MNPYPIFPKDKDPPLTLMVLLVGSVISAGILLFTSRFYPVTLVPAVLLLGVAVFLAGYSRYRLISLLVIALLTSLILSLRFDFLTWGDPWYDFGMVQRIITYQTLNPSIYTAQFPTLHVNIAVISLLSNFDPISLQKFIIPSVSIFAVYAVYKLTKDISSSETAFYAGLLLISGTPYLHWTTQGVRETIGLGLSILTLYVCIHAVLCESKGHLILSLLLIGGVVLTHHLSMGIFLLVWLAVSLTFLYLVCDINKMRKAVIFSLIITITSLAFMVGWWGVKKGYEFSQFNRLMNSIFLSDFGIPLFLVSLIIIYLIPLVVPKKISFLRSFIQQILERKDVIYKIFIIGTAIGFIVVLNSILGKSVFFLSYPLSMLLNGICMGFLSLIGLYYFLDKGRITILAWVAVLTLALILSLSNIFPVEDRIRFIEFLYIPLSIIAAFGLSRIAKSMGSPRIFQIIVTVFVVLSIVTSFPSVVFFGQPFDPGHPLYDNRSWVIMHQSSEISAILWLNNSHAIGEVDTDAYVGYVARGIIVTDSLTVVTGSFMRELGYPQYSDTNWQQHYLVILSRMTKYMEFSEQWLKEKNPLSDIDLTKINRECNILYDNGNAVIYSYSTP